MKGACPTGKEQFESVARAKKVRRSMKRRKKHSSSRLSVYSCAKCHYWHIGSNIVKSRRRGKWD